jgi:3-oxoadipate enol-lactonase
MKELKGWYEMNKIIVRNGTELAYMEQGEGQPIVLLHGYCGSHQYWNEVIPLLSTQGRVIAVDLRGHGASSGGDGVYSMELLAEDVVALLDELKLPKVHLIGHSLGGYVALAFAEQYPQRLLSLGLVHSTSIPDNEAAQANRLKAAESIQENGVNAFVDGLIPKLFAATHRTSMPETLTWAKEIGYGTSVAGAIGCALGMKIRPDRTSVLESLELPVLLLAGELDEVITAERRFPASRDNITALTLSRVAHMGMVEEPEPFAEAIVAFLEQNRRLESV